MTYERITKPKQCIHGIQLNRNCVKCIEFFISDYMASIRILKQKLRLIKQNTKDRNCLS